MFIVMNATSFAMLDAITDVGIRYAPAILAGWPAHFLTHFAPYGVASLVSLTVVLSFFQRADAAVVCYGFMAIWAVVIGATYCVPSVQSVGEFIIARPIDDGVRTALIMIGMVGMVGARLGLQLHED